MKIFLLNCNVFRSIILTGIGFLLLGIPSGAFDMPVLIDINSLLKNKYNYDENSAHDISSSIYLLALFLGDSIGPIMGGYLTQIRDFEYSCSITGIINLIFFIFLIFLYKTELQERIIYFKENYINKNNYENLHVKLLAKENFIESDKSNKKLPDIKTRRSSANMLYMLVVNKNLDYLNSNHPHAKNKKFNTTKYMFSIEKNLNLKNDFSKNI